jgi:hypothetical protein
MEHYALKFAACTLFMPYYCMEMTKTAFCCVWVLVSFVLLVLLVQRQLVARFLATVLNFEATALYAVTHKSAISKTLVHQLHLNSIVIHPNTAVNVRYCCSCRGQWGFHAEGDYKM